MKLKKLILKNIASIEEAEICFDQAPLDCEPVFLICGDTGSGKTTILDGICLALYNQTPRMNKTAKETYTDTSPEEDRSEDFTINDCRQLMRRNTAEAWSILEFTGSNDHEYRAEWYVARSRKRLNGNLQKVKWSLEDLTLQHTWTKSTEINQEILQAVGLNFAQYCRTALLAQGDFTQFLQSKEAEKSEILEKLTGTEIYSCIGAKIFALTRDRKRDYEEQQQRLGDIKILSEEEVNQILSEISGQEQELKGNEQEQQEIRRKSDWLKQEQELTEQIRKDEEKSQQITGQLNAPECKEKEEILSLWTETEEIRGIVKQKQRIAQEKQACRDSYRQLTEKYHRLLGDYSIWQTELQQLQQQRKRLELERQTLAPLIPMYEQSPVILGELRNLIRFEERIGKRHKELKDISEQLPRHQSRLQALQQEQKSREQHLEEQQKEIEHIRSLMGTDEYTRLQTEQKQLTDELLLLSRAQQVILLLKERVEQKQKSLTEQEQTQQALTKTGLQEEEARKTATQAAEAFRLSEELFEKQKLALSDWARELRNQLHRGDTCPVCGALVEKDLCEEDFRSALAPLQQELERKKQAKEQAEKVMIELQAHLKGLLDLNERQKKKLEDDKQAYRTTYQQTVEACAACGILQLQKETQALVDERIRLNKERQNEIGGRMKALQEQINRLNLKQQEKDRLQQETEKIRQEAHNEAVQIGRLQQGQEEVQRELQQDMQEKTATEESVYPKILWEDFRTDDSVSRNDWIERLEKETAHYLQQTEQYQKTLERIEQGEQQQKRIDEQRQIAVRTFPEWQTDTVPATGGTANSNLEADWTELSAKAIALNERIGRNEQEESQTRTAEKAFLDSHPDLSAEKIAQMSALSGAVVEGYRKEIQQLKDLFLEYSANLQRSRQSYQELLEQKPELNEQDTPEHLQKQLTELTGRMAEIHQNIGRNRAQIESNAQNLKRSEELRAQAEQCKNSYMQWYRLCSLFGDEKGKKFRNIAQSFVLKELLERANFYLGHLTERYELSCQAGSLTILLTDWYQGGVSRPASTLSGGEGFLVSLSLALGLSSLNRQSLSVDTLFIDEGFGTLSSDYLNVVMDTLERLHQLGGKKVGIISHVEGLRERIKTQIQVKRIDQGRSSISVTNENEQIIQNI